MSESDIAIKAENLGKMYILNEQMEDDNGVKLNEFWALQNISLEIKKGEAIGIIGTNGSGKSTFLKILAGVTKPSCGKATIQGRVASILDIGAGFHPELSGEENIFLNGQLLGFNKKEIAAKINKIIAFSEVEKFINQPVKSYSNGMYLRLAFSIMANLDFDVYLLDEVLNVGDSNFQLKVKKFIEDKRKQAATFVFVSHDLSTLIANCSSFYLMEKGRIINTGNYELVENYLFNSISKSHEHIPTNTFSNLDNHQLTNDSLKIKEIKVATNEDGFVIEDEPIQFSCLIEIEKTSKIDIAFGVENILGNDICYVSTLISNLNTEEKSFEKETVLIYSELPPFSVKKGNYILKLNVIINDSTPIISQFKALQFKIRKGKTNDTTMIDQRPNTAIIHGKWSYNKVYN